MVERAELLAAFAKIHARMINEAGEPVLPGWTRQIQFYFPDLDEYWLLQVVDGVPQGVERLDEEQDAEVRISMSSDTFVKLMNRTLSGFVAMTRGLVKVKASMADMRKMQVFM